MGEVKKARIIKAPHCDLYHIEVLGKKNYLLADSIGIPRVYKSKASARRFAKRYGFELED